MKTKRKRNLANEILVECYFHFMKPRNCEHDERMEKVIARMIANARRRKKE